ncbi:MAG: hypothetical protein ISQ06_01710 [Planctomycetaceae bacterium]|jgi:hypothetical protein|nr:hypothetical protein [Planctomycetaceae bacterium]
MGSDSRELDLVAELRLRQWARRNYVPAEQRSDSDWHAVVVSEMRRIDREIGRAERIQEIVTSAGIVPLERSQHQATRIDEPHDDVSVPKMHFTMSADSQVETFTPQYV